MSTQYYRTSSQGRSVSRAPMEAANATSDASYASPYGNAATAELVRASGDEAAAEVTLDQVDGLSRLGFAAMILVREGLLAADAGVGVATDAVVDAGLLGADGSAVRPDDLPTRAEAVAITSRYYGLETVARGDIQQVFFDLPASHWSADRVYGALKARFFTGHDDRTFRPDDAAPAPLLQQLLQWGPAGVGQAEYRFDPTLLGGAEAVIGGGSLDTPGSAQSLDVDALPTRDLSGSDAERAQDALDIIAALRVSGDSAAARYKDDGVKSYCNVFAHDYCQQMGAFLPRVWWNDGEAALAAVKAGEPLEAVVNQTVHEVRANGLQKWLTEWGARFGWTEMGTTDEATLRSAQDAANAGHIVVVTGSAAPSEDQQNNLGGGHVTVVRPEDAAVGLTAGVNASGKWVPQQAEAGLGYNSSGSTAGYFLGQSLSSYTGGTRVWMHE